MRTILKETIASTELQKNSFQKCVDLKHHDMALCVSRGTEGFWGGIVIVCVCESRASFLGFQNIPTKKLATPWNGKYNDDLSCMNFRSVCFIPLFFYIWIRDKNNKI